MNSFFATADARDNPTAYATSAIYATVSHILTESLQNESSYEDESF